MEDRYDSSHWAQVTGVIVMDPDGWNRQDFENSWNEKITLAEFKRRAWMSTVDFRSFDRADELGLW